MLLNAYRVLGLKGTAFAKAQCGTIRLKLKKIGALLRISVRRVLVSYASGYPWSGEFARIHSNLQAYPLRN